MPLLDAVGSLAGRALLLRHRQVDLDTPPEQAEWGGIDEHNGQATVGAQANSRASPLSPLTQRGSSLFAPAHGFCLPPLHPARCPRLDCFSSSPRLRAPLALFRFLIRSAAPCGHCCQNLPHIQLPRTPIPPSSRPPPPCPFRFPPSPCPGSPPSGGSPRPAFAPSRPPPRGLLPFPSVRLPASGNPSLAALHGVGPGLRTQLSLCRLFAGWHVSPAIGAGLGARGRTAGEAKVRASVHGESGAMG